MISCESFLLNKQALMLEAVFTNGYRSKIITTHGEYFSTKTVRELLELACIRYASTLEGRIQATKKKLGYSNKSPILIAPGQLGAFPTKSYKHLDCVWIFGHLFHVEEVNRETCTITFSNGMSYQVSSTKHILTNQQQRLHTLLNVSHPMHFDRESNGI